MIAPRTAFVSLLILASAATAACGMAHASNSHPTQPVVDQTSSARTAGPLSEPTATSDQATPGGDEAHPAQPPDDGYPRVLWMYVDDSDPAISIVHLATNVPTTASIFDANMPGHHLQLGHAEDTVLATEHTMRIAPGPNGAFNLGVSDGQNAAYAELRISSAVPDTYFGDGIGAPKLSLSAGQHGIATWETQLMTVPRPSLAGTVLVFADPFACKQVCTNTQPVATGSDQPVAVDSETDQHTVGFTFPDSAHDYVVLVGGVADGQHGTSEFQEFEVSASNLPQ